MSQSTLHSTPGRWANIRPVNFLSSHGRMRPRSASVAFVYSRAKRSNVQYTCTVKCLAHGCKKVPWPQPQILTNVPLSDSAIRTQQTRCINLLGHGTREQKYWRQPTICCKVLHRNNASRPLYTVAINVGFLTDIFTFFESWYTLNHQPVKYSARYVVSLLTQLVKMRWDLIIHNVFY